MTPSKINTIRESVPFVDILKEEKLLDGDSNFTSTVKATKKTIASNLKIREKTNEANLPSMVVLLS